MSMNNEHIGPTLIAIFGNTNLNALGTVIFATRWVNDWSISVQVLDYVVPLAWHAGQPFSIAAESSVEGLAHLAMAFMEGSPIVLDDMLELTEMTCECFSETWTYNLWVWNTAFKTKKNNVLGVDLFHENISYQMHSVFCLLFHACRYHKGTGDCTHIYWHTLASSHLWLLKRCSVN